MNSKIKEGARLGYMQNSNNSLYLSNKKIINIKSEILFREAEDDFYYFGNLNSALKKLNMSIELTPTHTKSCVLCADAYYIKGNYKKALENYKKALETSQKNAKILGSIASCYFSLKEYHRTIKFINKALNEIKEDEFSLFEQLLELKINTYLELKEYEKAIEMYDEVNAIAQKTSYKQIYASNFELLNEKLKKQQKVKELGLKIV